MRKLFLLPTLLLAACGSDGGTTTSFDDRDVVVAFADDVVVPTYQELDARMIALGDAVDALDADHTEANLTAVKDAWVATREPWEQSEGFLFGPVDSYGYDPALDSWPVNQTDLDAVLASDDDFTPEYIRNLNETQKGFHTIEYLIFGEDSAKTAAELTDREVDYLVALVDEAESVTGELVTAWTDGIMDQGPYRDVVATAGEDGNTAYPSRTAIAQQIIDAMIGICDEVANGKIADPYDAHDPDLVESQFSFNSLIDFGDNITSVRNVWTGGSDVAGTDGEGLDTYVDDLDATLGARVDREIQDALDALEAVPPPFPEAVQDPEAYDEIEAAQAAINTLKATLEGDLTDAVLH